MDLSGLNVKNLSSLYFRRFSCAALALCLLWVISYHALAAQGSTIDLGEQGVFPANHTLATIHVDDTVYTVDVEGADEDTLFSLYGFTLANQDYTETIENEYGYDLYVHRFSVETYTEEVEVSYETIRVADSTMDAGEETVETPGVCGILMNTYELRTLDGESSTELIDSQVISDPVTEVIRYGTRTGEATGYVNRGSALDLTDETIATVDSENMTFTTTSGTVYSYSSAVTCKAYAYCLKGKTATGTTARQGAIAVDPSVIPLGSKLFIIASDGSVVYGEAVAEDTGGNIKGHTVDLYYNTYSLCRSFGSRSVTIYILND